MISEKKSFLLKIIVLDMEWIYFLSKSLLKLKI